MFKQNKLITTGLIVFILAFLLLFAGCDFDPETDEYSITVPGAIMGGSITSDLSAAKEGVTVTLTITSNSNFSLKAGSLSVKDSNNTEITLNGTGITRTFIMPASNITVTGEFQTTAQYIALSGTVNVTLNGEPVPAGGVLFIDVFSAPDFNDQSIVDSGLIYPNGSWGIDIYSNFSGTLYFKVILLMGSAELEKDVTVTWTMGSSNININLGTVNFEIDTTEYFILSGTVNVTVNGAPISGDAYVYLEVYPNDDFIYSEMLDECYIDSNGNWVLLIPSDFSETLYFIVDYFDGTNWGDYIELDVTWTTGDSTTNIDLGTVNFIIN